mgnify:CR=1 FL=1
MKKLKINLSVILFFVGLLPLAYLNELLKVENTNSWLRFFIAVIYIISLRLLSGYLDSKVQRKRSK